MKFLFTLISLLLGFLINAQTTSGWTELEPSKGQPNLEFNPLKGIASNFGGKNGFPSTLKGQVYQLGEIYSGNQINFAKIDSLLDAEAKLGRFTILQINLDDGRFINPADQTVVNNGTVTYPGKKFDLPDFLDSVDGLYYLGGQDDFLIENDLVNRVFKAAPEDTEGNPSLVINYNDPLLMDTIISLIEQLGERYDNDERLFGIGWGIYGIFGELQLGSGKFWIDQIPNPATGGFYQKSDWELSEENKYRISQAYLTYFPNTQIIARDGTVPSADQFGFSDGLFFGASISNTNPFFFLRGLSLNNVDKNWKYHPIGGEMDPFVQPHVWGNTPVSATNPRPFVDINNTGDPNLTSQENQNLQQVIEQTHMTFVYQNYMFKAGEVGLRGRNHRSAPDLSDYNLAKYKFQNENNTIFWDNALVAVKRMGYNFHVKEYNLSAQDGNTAVEVNIINTGVAPMYANWDVEFACLNDKNELIQLGTSSTWQISTILPITNLSNKRKFISDQVLSQGTYTVLMRIVNPLNTALSFADGRTIKYDSGTPLRFDNATQDVDQEGWLTIGVVEIDENGNAGNFPSEATNLIANTYNETMPLRGDQQLSVIADPDDTDYFWVSNREQIATVDQNGRVTTFNQTGNVIISAITLDGNIKAEFPITVNNYTQIPNRIEAEDFSEVILANQDNGFSNETNAEQSDKGNPALGNFVTGNILKYNVCVKNPLGEDFYMNFRASVNFSGDGPTANKVKVFNEAGDEITKVDFLVNQGDAAGNFTIYQSSRSEPFYLPFGNHTIM